MHSFCTKIFTLGGGSMLLLVAMFSILLIYIVERTVFLHSGNVKPQQFIAGIIALLKHNRHREAITICEETHGFVPSVVKIVLFFSENGNGWTDYAVKNFVLSVVPTLERRLGSIALIGKIAPIVGCIGACVVFSGFMSNAVCDNYMQSEPIFALIKSILTVVAFALFVNVCANIGYNFLYGRVRTLLYSMEWAYIEMVNFLAQEHEK
jgi:biopolymer transport protein ExbB/TolQ